MEIITDIALTEQDARAIKKFKNLSVNQAPLPQGDGTIRISPFDDYFIFTLYDEVDGVNVPIDLSNVGTIYMSFIGSKDEIRIPNFTNVKDIDMASGEVLFRISKDESRKILALSNRTFYISTVMEDPDGVSDESVIYTGKFLSFEDAAQVSLTKQLEDTTAKFTKQISSLQETINRLISDNATKDNVIAEQSGVIEVLKQSNQNLSNEITVLSDRLSSTEAEALIRQAKEAQKAEEDIKRAIQQVESIKKASEETAAEQKAFIETAVKQLRSNITGPLVSPGSNLVNEVLKKKRRGLFGRRR